MARSTWTRAGTTASTDRRAAHPRHPLLPVSERGRWWRTSRSTSGSVARSRSSSTSSTTRTPASGGSSGPAPRRSRHRCAVPSTWSDERVGGTPSTLSVDIDVLDPCSPLERTSIGGINSRERSTCSAGSTASTSSVATWSRSRPLYDHAEITCVSRCHGGVRPDHADRPRPTSSSLGTRDDRCCDARGRPPLRHAGCHGGPCGWAAASTESSVRPLNGDSPPASRSGGAARRPRWKARGVRGREVPPDATRTSQRQPCREDAADRASASSSLRLAMGMSPLESSMTSCRRVPAADTPPASATRCRRRPTVRAARSTTRRVCSSPTHAWYVQMECCGVAAADRGTRARTRRQAGPGSGSCSWCSGLLAR